MASSWFAVVMALVECLRAIATFFSKEKRITEQQTQQENRTKAEGYDLLIKALQARRKARAGHLDDNSIGNNSPGLPINKDK
jgi:hypothetical protein